MAHGLPTAEFVRNAQANKIVPLAPAAFLGEQIMLLGPVGAIVAIVGAIALATRRLPGGRLWLVAVVATLAVFLLQRSKAYYVMPAYPVLLVAGAVTLERWLATRVAPETHRDRADARRGTAAGAADAAGAAAGNRCRRTWRASASG